MNKITIKNLQKLSLLFFICFSYLSSYGQIEINTWEDLNNVRNDLSASYILNVDLNENSVGYQTYASASANANDGWEPIGSASSPFTGTFDGNNKTINGLVINRPTLAGVGFFGKAHGASISDLTLTNVDITGSHEVGSLIGTNIPGTVTQVNNVHVTGAVTSARTGSNAADCGGLLGFVYNINVINSSTSVVVTAEGRNVGGIVGDGTTDSWFSGCFATGSVTSTGNQGQVGGFAGLYRGSGISNSFSLGNVTRGGTTGSSSVGAGGFIGSFTGTSTISNCYSIGKVTSTSGGTTNIGGFIGTGASEGTTLSNCYWDTDVSNLTSDYGDGTKTGVNGLTTTDMKDQTNFSGWDFSGVWSMSSPLTYNGYPALDYTSPISVAPTTANEIATLANLLWIAEDDTRWNGNYTQTADINTIYTFGWNGNSSASSNYTARGWTPIGENISEVDGGTQFTGDYDGQGFTISNLYIDNISEIGMGLFGWIKNANIQNLKLSDGNIRGRGRTGIIIGRADDSVLSRLSASGTAYGSGQDNGYSQVGGIVGYLVDSSVTESFSSVIIDSNGGSLGSLVGFCTTADGGSGSSITNSYATGAVTSQNNSDYLGGLTGGLQNTSVTNSYATGEVTSTEPNNVGGLVGGELGSSSVVTNSFYDTETSGLNVSAIGGSGKTTTEMQQASTFLEANWDFTSSNEIWGINQNDNNGYPFLRYQDNVSDSDHIYLGTSTGLLTNPSSWSEASVPTSTSAIRIPSKTASNNTNLEVNSNLEIASLVIENEEGNLVVLPTKSIKVNGNITNNGQITFKSDVTGDSYLDEFSGSISGTGNVVVEKYYPAKRAFRMVTSTVNSTTSIYDNWQNGGLNQGDTGFEAGIGTHITGSATGDDGFDQTSSGAASMFEFITGSGWQTIANTNATYLEAGKPYRLMIRGDRGIDLTDGEDENATTLISTGDLQVGTVTEEFPSAASSGTTFAFLANPYQSKIDVSSLLSNNSNAVDDKYWVWDPMINTRGGFVLVSDNNNTWGLTPSDTNNTSAFSTVPKFIEPGQAFFIQLTGTDSNISFTESVKDNTTSPKPAPFSDNQMSLLFELQNEGNQTIDAIRLRFATDGITEVDAADIAKMGNLDENLASVNENSLFTIQRRSFPENDEIIPLFTNNWRNENYSFVPNLSNFGTTAVYLVDAYLGTETLLEDGETYSFDVDESISESVATLRFSLKFDTETMGVEDEDNKLFSLYPNPAQEMVNIQTSLALGTTVEVEIYNMLGQQIYAAKHELKSPSLEVDVSAFNSGVYSVKLNDEAGNEQTQQLIKE